MYVYMTNKTHIKSHSNWKKYYIVNFEVFVWREEHARIMKGHGVHGFKVRTTVKRETKPKNYF